MTVKNRGFDHPTVKPVDVICDLLEVSSKENHLIFDPFAGTGTTGVACKQMKRRAILIEKEEKYCEIAANRLYQEYLL